MNSKLFSIGDIVTVSAHPYFSDLTGIIIGGDALSIPPLLVIKEVFKATIQDWGTPDKIETYKYTCCWYSAKYGNFKDVQLAQDELKLIKRNTSTINKNILSRGAQVVLKSFTIELAKKKSSLSHEERSRDSGMDSKVINPLLSFVPPVMQLSEISSHSTKKNIYRAGTNEKIRDVHSWDVKCTYYDQIDNKFSQVILPLEALEVFEPVEESSLFFLQKIIDRSAYLFIKGLNEIMLLKPKHLAYRGGKYYCSGFDYILNRMREVEISTKVAFEEIVSPFVKQAPSFDISRNNESASPLFIVKEIVDLIDTASEKGAYLRIKYKNKNDEISYRTVKKYKVVKAKEEQRKVLYLVGFCLQKQGRRNFRIDRIQNIQELILVYKKSSSKKD
ncbi:MAG: WYL domain-containing protein [Niastella sp.]|nr:WYL domain-containing protein [Niastella sp.]